MFELTVMMMRNKLQVHIRNPSVIEEQFLLSGKDTMIIVVLYDSPELTDENRSLDAGLKLVYKMYNEHEVQAKARREPLRTTVGTEN